MIKQQDIEFSRFEELRAKLPEVNFSNGKCSMTAGVHVPSCSTSTQNNTPVSRKRGCDDDVTSSSQSSRQVKSLKGNNSQPVTDEQPSSLKISIKKDLLHRVPAVPIPKFIVSILDTASS